MEKREKRKTVPYTRGKGESCSKKRGRGKNGYRVRKTFPSFK